MPICLLPADTGGLLLVSLPFASTLSLLHSRQQKPSPWSMPCRGAMKAASFRRPRGCLDAASACSTRARAIKATPRRQDRATASSNGSRSNSNVKLQELKLAFCLLSREIQGLDEGEKNTPDGVPGCAAKKTTQGAEEDLQQPSAAVIPPAGTTQGDSQQPHALGEAKKPRKCLVEKVDDVSRHEGHNKARGRSGTAGASTTHEGAACNEGRKAAAEAAASEAKEALKQLRVELDAERMSRVAAER